jgi:hypothetical protein
MRWFRKTIQNLKTGFEDEAFILFLEQIQVVIAKVLSLAMIALIIVGCFHLIFYLGKQLLFDRELIFKNTLFELFWLVFEYSNCPGIARKYFCLSQKTHYSSRISHSYFSNCRCS